MTPDGESPLTFPCEFPVKAMGRQDAAFPDRVLDLVGRHSPEAGPERVRVTASRAGRYQSVTVTVTATSRAQLDAIYMDLTADSRVRYAL